MIEKIKNIIGNEPLKITIYDDEIIFELWEIEVPIVYERKSKKITFKLAYCELCSDDNYQGLDIDTINEIHKVMLIIDCYKDEISKW